MGMPATSHNTCVSRRKAQRRIHSMHNMPSRAVHHACKDSAKSSGDNGNITEHVRVVGAPDNGGLPACKGAVVLCLSRVPVYLACLYCGQTSGLHLLLWGFLVRDARVREAQNLKISKDLPKSPDNFNGFLSSRDAESQNLKNVSPSSRVRVREA